jgi:hypothetical protein
MDSDGVGAHAPLTATWTAPRGLEITLPNDASVGTQKQAFGDIAISYRYIPDDPLERACLRKWRSLPFDERQQYDYVNGVKDFVATCRIESNPDQGK